MTKRERCLRAKECHEKGLNCGQSVLLAFTDVTGLTEAQSMAVASGFHDVVIVAGVEKMTDTVGKDTTAGLATASDAENEALHGVSFVGLNALIMQRYMYEHAVPLDAFVVCKTPKVQCGLP